LRLWVLSNQFLVDYGHTRNLYDIIHQMRILVTGTTGGIGGAVKAAALAHGHAVIEVNRGEFESWDTTARLESAPYQDLDAVVFCTGTCPVRPVALTADELLMETVRVNCGLFLSMMRTIVAEKLYNPAGLKAIAVSSVSATEGWPGGAAYCASKGALSAMCRAMDAELGSKKISVKAIEPRYVKTKMFDACAGRMGVPASEAQAPEVLAEEILVEIEAK